MKIEGNFYGGVCNCGAEHKMETRLCVIEAGALARFEAYAAEAGISGRRCAVYDRHTYAIPGLRRPAANQEIVLEPDGLHANEVSTAEILNEMGQDAEVLIAVGGGTIHDIVRYCAKQRGLRFISIPTAASCDGFCSAVAAMTWNGYKHTIPCAAPTMVVADLCIIRDAPMYLTASGVGDMLGKYIALADWRISHAVAGETVCPVILNMMREATEQIWEHCPKLWSQALDSFQAVTYGLLLSGLAMQLMGSSRPASGAEHHISHLIETEPASLGVYSTALHGEKVGVGTLLVSDEYHRLAEIADISPLVVPYYPLDGELAYTYFGKRLYRQVLEENFNDCLASVTPEALIQAWPEIRSVISSIPTAEAVSGRLAVLKAKKSLEDIGVPEDKRQIILHAAPLIRNRLTLMRMRRMILAQPEFWGQGGSARPQPDSSIITDIGK